MKNLDQLQAERHLALERYQSAIAELRAAYTHLLGLDHAVNNRHAGGQVRTFVHPVEHLPEELRHPDVPHSRGERWSEEARARAETHS